MRFPSAFGVYSTKPFTVVDGGTIVKSSKTDDFADLSHIVIIIRLDNDYIKLIGGEAELRTITFPRLILNAKEVKWIKRTKLPGTMRCDLEIVESNHEILELENTLCSNK